MHASMGRTLTLNCKMPEDSLLMINTDSEIGQSNVRLAIVFAQCGLIISGSTMTLNADKLSSLPHKHATLLQAADSLSSVMIIPLSPTLALFFHSTALYKIIITKERNLLPLIHLLSPKLDQPLRCRRIHRTFPTKILVRESGTFCAVSWEEASRTRNRRRQTLVRRRRKATRHLSQMEQRLRLSRQRLTSQLS